VDELLRTVDKLHDVDAHANVFVAAAHDEALLDHVVFFPDGTVNAFVKKAWLKRVHWAFLRGTLPRQSESGIMESAGGNGIPRGS